MSTKQTRQLSPFDKTQAEITAHNEVAILNALKDYLAKKYNTNFANIKANLDAIKNALNGLSGVTQHLGVPHEPSATPPTNPNEYDWYFDLSTNKFMMYHNSAWVMIADLANLINLDAKYLQITDAARDYLPRNDFQTALILKADKSDTYTSSVIDGKLDLKQTKLTPAQQSVVDAQPFTADEKRTLANALTASSGDITNLSSQVTTNTADIASNKAAIATKQDAITGVPLSVLQANPFTDEALAKVNTAIQQADISDVLRTGDVYSNSEIDQKVSGAKGQFEKGTLKELNDLENGVGVPDSAHKVLVLDEVKGLEAHRNDITKKTLANFVDKVIYKDANTLEYYDTILDIEVKDAAAVTSGNIMTLTNKLDVYGRIYVEGTSFGAVFKVPCAVEYNFLGKNKGVKFYGTPGQDYKWELFGKYEGGERVNWIKFSGSSTMSITSNPGVASPTWTTQPMPYVVKMSDIFDKDNKLALIKLDYDVLPADGDHILNLEYLTTLPYVEARFANIIAQLQNNITTAKPNFSPEQQAVLAANAFTKAYKDKLDNAPDDINTVLGGKLDASTYNTEKVNFLTDTDISGKADTSYVNTELGRKQNTLTDQDKLAIAKLYFTETLKTKYDGYEATLNTKADASALTGKVDTTTLTTELAKKQNVLTDPEKTAISKLSFTDTLKNKYDTYATSKADASATTTALGLKANKTDVTNSLALKQDKLSTTQLGLLASDAIKFTQAVDNRITANRADITNLKQKGAFLGKFADAPARDTALKGTTLVNGDYVILGDPAVRWVYDLRSAAWVEDISHSAAISSISLEDVAHAQDPKIATARQEAITSANTHTDGAIATLTTTVNGKQDHIDAGKLALLDGAVKYTQADKSKVDSALQSHQDISGKANTSWVTTELNKKQNNLSVDEKAVLAGKVFTQTEKDKLARAITSQQDISGKADTTYVNQELAKKQDNLSSDQLAVVNASPFTSNEKTKLAGLSELTKSNVLTQLNLPQIQLDILKRTKEFTQDEKTKLASAITSHQNISGKADSTWVTSQLNSKFTQNSAKLVVNDTNINPGDAKIGHGYKGTQSYGEGGSIQHYGKDAVNTVSLGQGARSEVTVGKNATGSVMIGSDSSTIAADHQKLIHGNKSASFSSIIDVAGGNVFTTAYKNKLDTALQPSAITGKVDASTMNNALANKQGTLSQSQLNVLAGHPYTTTDQGKVASALQPAALNAYYTSSQIDTKLNTKKNTFSDNLLLKSGSSASTAIFLSNTRYHTQSYLDDSGAYVGAFNANNTKYATVKMIGEEPALFGHDSTKEYVVKFKDIQAKLSDAQLAVANANAFTNTYKTKLDNTASQAEISHLAKKDLSNVVTTQEKASFISNLQRIGVQVSLFNEFKGVHPSDPASPHNDLDWYINDTNYEIKVWHQNAWHSVGKPTHTLSNAEVLTALGLTQTDITNLKYITNVRTTLSSIIGKGNEISHLPANTITALNDKADKATTYTRVDIDGKLNSIKQAAVNDALSGAASAATTSINNAIAGKADSGASYTKIESDGRYATKTALAGKQDNINSNRLLDTHSTSQTAILRMSGSAKISGFIGGNAELRSQWSNSEYGSLRADGNGPLLYGRHGSDTYSIPFSELNKVKSLTTSAIENAKRDHSLYALKSELSAAVDLDNTLKFIDGKVFSGRSSASDYILPNNTRIYDNFVIEGTDGIIETTEVTVNTALRGWQTLGRIKPGSHGATYAFDITGYYESDGGISKFRVAVGAAGVYTGWSYVRERIKVKALASQSKGMSEALYDFVDSRTATLLPKIATVEGAIKNMGSQIRSMLNKAYVITFDDGTSEIFRAG